MVSVLQEVKILYENGVLGSQNAIFLSLIDVQIISVRQEAASSHTTGICRPFPEVSSSFPKH